MELHEQDLAKFCQDFDIPSDQRKAAFGYMEALITDPQAPLPAFFDAERDENLLVQIEQSAKDGRILSASNHDRIEHMLMDHARRYGWMHYREDDATKYLRALRRNRSAPSNPQMPRVDIEYVKELASLYPPIDFE